MKSIKILVINLGSTSTKVSYYINNECVIKDNISHDAEQIRAYKDVIDQYNFRKQVIIEFVENNGIKLDELDSITSRGGQTEPVFGGTYRINADMVKQVKSGEYGHHVCNVGVIIAYDLCHEHNGPIPLTTDTPTTDEMDSVARFSGLKELERVSCVQALNTKAMARYYAETHGIDFKDARLVTVMLGGGIGVCAIRDGRMVDAPDGLEGEGPFSNNRCGTVPVGKIIKLCYSGEYTCEEMIRHINGDAGLMAYLGTTDLRGIMKKIDDGDSYAREVIEAMCYQISKEIGAMATVLEGKVDAILLTGGMANVKFITDTITKRVGFIADVEIMPGEREMLSLAEGAYKAVIGDVDVKEFIPKKGGLDVSNI